MGNIILLLLILFFCNALATEILITFPVNLFHALGNSFWLGGVIFLILLAGWLLEE